MANGNGTDGLPTWAKSLITLVLQHGVAVVIALFLVWFIAGRMTNDHEQLKHDLAEHDRIAAESRRTMTAFADAQAAETRMLIALMRQTCVNTARTDEQRRECVR